MRRAVELFTIERHLSPSLFLEETWRAGSAPQDRFISVAATHWEMVVTRQRGAVRVTVRGPETRATTVPIPAEAEFFGIQFGLAAFMPGLPPAQLVDRSLTLPPVATASFWLHGSAWELPDPDNADVFVERLVRAGLLVHDPVALAAVEGPAPGLSTRSLERRVVRATGLTRGTIRQIRRAERAVELLAEGMAAPAAAHRAGYADQSHLTRSLKHFVGQTPSEIAGSGTGEP